MKEQEPKEPKLRVLPQDSQSSRLEPMPNDTLLQEERVEVLKPDAAARLEGKFFEPDVSEILDRSEKAVDSEATWGIGVKKAPPLGWFVLAGIIVFGLALWAAVNVFKAQNQLGEVVEEKKELAVDQVNELKEVRHTLDLMKECVRGYLTAENVEGKLPYVRHPNRVKSLMESYYSNHTMKQEDFRHFERIRSMGLETLSFVYGQVELRDGKKHQLLLEQLEDGTFRVDWESDVCYLPIDWDQYVETSPTKPVVMRVFIKRDHFFAYEFTDDERFDSYQLTTRDSDDHVFGFVEKGSDVAMDINRFVKRVEAKGGGEIEPLMLLLRFPEDGHSKKCVWIDRLIEPRWTYVKSPDADLGNEK